MAMEKGSAACRMNGKGAEPSRGFRYWIAAAPPTAEASEPTTVTPIWTVARKRWGSFWIASTSLARGLPAAARLAIWLLRAEITASSEHAKKAVCQDQEQNDHKFIEEHFHGYFPP